MNNTMYALAAGSYYRCGRDINRTHDLYRHIETVNPELIVVVYSDPVFGTIGDIQENFESVASVGRLDLYMIMEVMKQQNKEMLTAHACRFNYENRYFMISIDVEGYYDYKVFCDVDWNSWHPLDLPQIAFSKQTLEIVKIIKMLTPLLNGTNTLSKKTVLGYLDKLIKISRCDICRETQEFLGTVRAVFMKSDDKELLEYVEVLNKAITEYGSLDRVPEYIDYWHNLVDSKEADDMMRKWIKRFEKKHDKESKRLLYLEQIRKLEENLESLPRELWDEYTDMETFMHSIVYTYISRSKWQSLMTELVLRQRLYEEMNHLEASPQPSPEGKGVETPEVVEEAKVEPNEDYLLVRELKVCFFGDEEETRIFLQSIVGMKPKEITNYVSKKVKARKISDSSCHRTMWQILHFHGIYKCSESNWNKQI